MSLEQKIDSLVQALTVVQSDIKQVKTDTHTIRRGMYGDPDNKFPGLIERQAHDEKDIKELKEGRKKFLWLIAGFTFAIQLIFVVIKFLTDAG